MTIDSVAAACAHEGLEDLPAEPLQPIVTNDQASESKPCGAKLRNGSACQRPGLKNGRCEWHGGLSTGARTPEGKQVVRHATWKHGRRSAESRLIAKALKTSGQLIEALYDPKAPPRTRAELMQLIHQAKAMAEAVPEARRRLEERRAYMQAQGNETESS